MNKYELVLIVWVIGSLCNFLFKAQSPEEYATMAARKPEWFFKRFAAFWQFLGGLMIDPQKVATALIKIITGKVE